MQTLECGTVKKNKTKHRARLILNSKDKLIREKSIKMGRSVLCDLKQKTKSAYHFAIYKHQKFKSQLKLLCSTSKHLFKHLKIIILIFSKGLIRQISYLNMLRETPGKKVPPPQLL